MDECRGESPRPSLGAYLASSAVAPPQSPVAANHVSIERAVLTAGPETASHLFGPLAFFADNAQL